MLQLVSFNRSDGHDSALPHCSPYRHKHHFTCSSLPPPPAFHVSHFTPRGFAISTSRFGLPSALLRWTVSLSGARTLWRSGFGLASLTEVAALCVRREGRFLSDGLHPKRSSTGSSPLLVMCGATGSSCGKSCPTERGLTGTWPIKMYVVNLPVVSFWNCYWAKHFWKMLHCTHTFFFASWVSLQPQTPQRWILSLYLLSLS